MTDPQQLMRTHLQTGFTLDASGRLRSVNAPKGGTAPRFFIGQTLGGNQWWFRDDLEDELVFALEALCSQEQQVEGLRGSTLDSEPYEEVLRARAEIEQVWTGPTYCFPDTAAGSSRAEFIEEEQREFLDPYLAEWLGDVTDCQPFAIIREKGRAVSLCATVRRSATAEEAGVETHAAFRGRGLAGEVVAAWGHAVRVGGRAPLYSTSWTNKASMSVARKLGLTQYGAVLHIR